MTAILALLQEQKTAMSEQKMAMSKPTAAMSEQKMAMSEQKVAISEQKAAAERLEVSVTSRLDLLAGQWNEEIRKVTEQQKMANKSFAQHFDRVEARLKKLEARSILPGTAPPALAGSSGQSDFPLLVDPSGVAPSAEDLRQVQKLLGPSNPAAFNDKLVSQLLSDGNVHLREFLPCHLAPSSDTTFMVEDDHLQLSATVKQFRLAAGVLRAVQSVLGVLLVAGKLGMAATFAYRDQVQKLLDRGHSWQWWSAYTKNF